jgi:hypothetical protein
MALDIIIGSNLAQPSRGMAFRESLYFIKDSVEVFQLFLLR